MRWQILMRGRHLYRFHMRKPSSSLLAIELLTLTLTCSLSFGQEKEDWDKVLAGARKEGKVVVYGTSSFRPMIKEVEV